MIYVLLILAGISIAMLSGNNGILQRVTDAKQTSEKEEAKEQAKMDIMAYIADKTANHQDASLDDRKVKEILSDNKTYVKTAKETSFITSNGEYEIPYSELYHTSNVTPSNSVEFTNNLAIVRAKIQDKSEDCMIDENGTIMPITTWNYIPTGEDTCKLEGYYDEDNDVNLNAYKGEQIDAYSFKYEIPVFVKVGNTIYTVNELGVDALAYYGNINNTILIPSSIKTIGQSAFQCNANIKSIIIPDTVTSINNTAFNNCLALTSITIPSSVTSMGKEVFKFWTESQLINVPFKEGERPNGWRDDWNVDCNAQINYLP